MWRLQLRRAARTGNGKATLFKSSDPGYEKTWSQKELAMHPRQQRSFRFWVEHYDQRVAAGQKLKRTIDDMQMVTDRVPLPQPGRKSLGFGHRPGTTRPLRALERREARADDARADSDHLASTDSAWRLSQMGLLSNALFRGGGVAELLVDADDDYSANDLCSAYRQGHCLLMYLKKLEERVEGETVHAAADAVAANYPDGCVSGRTIREWLSCYVGNGCKIQLPSRGKWQREILILEEDLREAFVRWMKQQAKKESLDVDAGLKYLNEVLLKEVDAELLSSYNITLPISRKTAWRWMRLCGARHEEAQKSYYCDQHETAPVVAYRGTYCNVRSCSSASNSRAVLRHAAQPASSEAQVTRASARPPTHVSRADVSRAYVPTARVALFDGEPVWKDSHRVHRARGSNPGARV